MTGALPALARCLDLGPDARDAVSLWLATATDDDLADLAAMITEAATAPGFRLPVPEAVPCPTCHEPAGASCRTWHETRTTHHWPRWRAAIAAQAFAAPRLRRRAAKWTPAPLGAAIIGAHDAAADGPQPDADATNPPSPADGYQPGRTTPLAAR